MESARWCEGRAARELLRREIYYSTRESGRIRLRPISWVRGKEAELENEHAVRGSQADPGLARGKMVTHDCSQPKHRERPVRGCPLCEYEHRQPRARAQRPERREGSVLALFHEGERQQDIHYQRQAEQKRPRVGQSTILTHR